MLIPQLFTKPSTSQKFNTQGHRGCRGLMPENTIPAMLYALELGVVTVEMDVCISKDKQVFLSHEPYFNHLITTSPTGNFIEENEEHIYNLYNMFYEEITSYDVGLKQHSQFPKQQKLPACKPLLSEVFHSIKQQIFTESRPFPFFNIEIKCLPETDNIYHPEPAIFVELVMKVIREAGMEKQVNLQSFDFRCLQYIHQYYPQIPIALLIEGDDKRSFKDQLKALGFLPDIYSPEQSLVTEALIKDCHHQKINIIPWTVNDLNKMQSLKNMGVDGIISDYPDLFEKLD